MLAAIGVGPIFTLPFSPTHPPHCMPCSSSFASAPARRFYPGHSSRSSSNRLAVIASIAFVLAPAVNRILDEPEMRGRVRCAGIASSALVLSSTGLIVLRPSWT